MALASGVLVNLNIDDPFQVAADKALRLKVTNWEDRWLRRLRGRLHKNRTHRSGCGGASRNQDQGVGSARHDVRANDDVEGSRRNSNRRHTEGSRAVQISQRR
jgi:hypothetical protein